MWCKPFGMWQSATRKREKSEEEEGEEERGGNLEFYSRRSVKGMKKQFKFTSSERDEVLSCFWKLKKGWPITKKKKKKSAERAAEKVKGQGCCWHQWHLWKKQWQQSLMSIQKLIKKKNECCYNFFFFFLWARLYFFNHSHHCFNLQSTHSSEQDTHLHKKMI